MKMTSLDLFDYVALKRKADVNVHETLTDEEFFLHLDGVENAILSVALAAAGVETNTNAVYGMVAAADGKQLTEYDINRISGEIKKIKNSIDYEKEAREIITHIIINALRNNISRAELLIKKLLGSGWDYVKFRRLFLRELCPLPEENEEKYFDWLEHQAKYENEIEYREVMRCETIGVLKSGRQLPKAARSWLAYVIEHAEIPHENATKPRQTRLILIRRVGLAQFLFEDEKVNARSSVTARLKRAASHLHTTFETVKNDYYQSDEFGLMMEALRANQPV